MKYIFLYVIVIFSFFSCNSKTKINVENDGDSIIVMEASTGGLFSIDIAEALREVKKGKIPLSALGNSIEYIPLETTSESLFGEGRHGLDVEVVSDKVILINMKRFDRCTGHYLGDLMKKGEGPGEYLWIRGGLADDEREEYYLHDMTKMQIHRVGYDGIFKESISCGDFVNVFSLGGGKLLIAMAGPLNNSYDDFYIMDIDSRDILLTRRSSALRNIQSLDECKGILKAKNGYWKIGKNAFWQYGDKVRYYDCLTDSVYTITRDLKVIPVGLFQMGDLRLTKEQADVGVMSRNFFTWDISSVQENSEKMFVNVSAYKTKPTSETKSFKIVYSKKDKTLQVYPNGDIYENDLDNTISFSPKLVQGSSYFYRLLSIEAIKERAGKPFTKNARAFKEMAAKLKFDDNDVVVIVR